MKKRIFYGLIFTSLMIISSVAVFTQPSVGANWKFGVPDAAKGMTTESEVKVYDKEAWGEHVGQIIKPDDNVNNWFGGDQHNANDVGAKSKSKILDWGSEDIYFFGDHLMTSEIGSNPLGLSTYWDGVTLTDDTCEALSAYYTVIVGGMTAANSGAGNITAASNAENNLFVGTPSHEEAEILWAKTFKGIILERNKWEFDLDYDDDPDLVADNVPFIEDPHDIWESWLYFNAFVDSIFNKIDELVVDAGTIDFIIDALPPINHTVINNALAGQGLPTYDVCLLDIQTQLLTIKGFFASKIPDKKEYLNLLLRSGLPAHQPVDSWWEKVIDDFNIEDDVYWGTGTYTHQGGIEVDGMVVTVEYEWEEAAQWQDVDGTMVKFDDYEVEYTYSDTGGQSSVEFKGSDTFYKIESLAPVIPGYEITILLATAAISAIALIYVVMKKRRM
jgi:hypothetical protein